jgi:polar amino acid transport system substrate-binding protein
MADSEQQSAITRRGLLTAGGAAVVGGVAGFGLHAAVFQTPATAAPSSGTSKLAQVLERGKLIVGTDSATPPNCFKDAQGNWTGFDIELAHDMASQLFGDPDAVEFVDEPGSARIPNLQADKVDLVMQVMTITAERAKSVNFSTPYLHAAANVVFAKNSKYNSYEDMHDSSATVATMTDAEVEARIHLFMPGVNVLQLQTQSAGIEAVDSGRADAAFVEHGLALYMAATSPDKYKAGVGTFGPNNDAIALKKGDDEWLQWVNTVVQEWTTGILYPTAYAPSYEKWYGTVPTPPQAGSPLQ